MNDRQPDRTPDIGGVTGFVTPLIWESKWLIGGTAIVAASVAFALAQASSVQMWSGRTTLTVGLAPSINYVLFEDIPAVEPIEPTRVVVARISDPGFRAEMLNKASFAPATAARSRLLVGSSLRGIVLEGDRDIAVELSAASPEDVEVALRALGAEIAQVHGQVLDQRMQMLQQKIDKAKSRIAVIERSSDELLARVFESEDKTRPRPSVFTVIPAWNDLQDSVQRDTNLKQVVQPSVVHLSPGTFVQGPRNAAALKASLLAGLAMLLAMVVLTVVIKVRTRPSAQ